MRAILFDFGGTMDFPRHWLDRFLSHYREAGFSLSRSELDLAFDAATRTAYHSTAQVRHYQLAELLDYLIGLQLVFLRDHRMLTGANPDLQNPSILSRALKQIGEAFVAESRRGMSVSREVLANLKDRFTLGVVSNFYGNLDVIMSEAGFDGIVAGIADSGVVGIYKPDLGIYKAALSAIGAEPLGTVMVGDSLDKDCAPAQALGMRTVWLRHREAEDPPSSLAADFTIRDLNELKALL
ncbi:MAG TPA: HAD family hydrolase [Candidatus Binataceae bacterium]|nr:HAD family hydrolase [Candidatus Binataceae bacterium]